MDQDFGFCLDEDICPVWLSELGCALDRELHWFQAVCGYLEKKQVDFAYWPLNVGPKPGGSDDERLGQMDKVMAWDASIASEGLRHPHERLAAALCGSQAPGALAQQQKQYSDVFGTEL